VEVSVAMRLQRLSEPVSVLLLYDHLTGLVRPWRLRRDGTGHRVLRVGLHHTYRRGRVLIHVYGVVTDTLHYYRLELNTETLQWTVEEISDGLPD
jgi:hypothetical protein